VSFTVGGRICDRDSDVLEAVRGLLHRLRPDWRDAEAFYELRSEATGALTRLLRQAARDPRPLTRMNGHALPARSSHTAAPALGLHQEARSSEGS
jgi:hypothetical protein